MVNVRNTLIVCTSPRPDGRDVASTTYILPLHSPHKRTTMGKRLQGAALRSKKRQKALTEKLQEEQAEQVARQSVVDQSDKELFVLDTKGDHVPSTPRPSPFQRTGSKKSKETVWSNRERRDIENLLKRHSKEELASMAADGQRLFDKTNHLRTHGIRKSKTPPKTFDLWGDAKSLQSGKQKDEKKKALKGEKSSANLHDSKRANMVAVDVARGGQSYRPDPVEHQSVLREALNVEERRDKAEIEKNAPLSPGMSEATKAILLADSDSSDDEEGEGQSEGANDESKMVFHKQKGKLTRAQRNKQKRVRQEERERLDVKREQERERQVFQIKRLRKEVKLAEEQQKERLEEKRKRVEEKASEKKGSRIEKEVSVMDPVAAPSFPVALTSELCKGESSLRTMIPKGSLVTDRMASYALRSLSAKLPSHAAAQKELASRKKRRPKKKVKGGKEWRGENFVIIK